MSMGLGIFSSNGFWIVTMNKLSKFASNRSAAHRFKLLMARLKRSSNQGKMVRQPFKKNGLHQGKWWPKFTQKTISALTQQASNQRVVPFNIWSIFLVSLNCIDAMWDKNCTFLEFRSKILNSLITSEACQEDNSVAGKGVIYFSIIYPIIINSLNSLNLQTKNVNPPHNVNF